MSSLRCLCLIILLTTFYASGQVYNFQYLNNKNGLPQSQAYAICFDYQNMAWIGTQGGGIAIYDGQNINYLTKQDSLVSNRVYCFETIGNEIYIGCKGGVSVAGSNKQIVRSYKFDTSSVIVNDIMIFQNKIWIGTDQGLYYLAKDKIEPDVRFKSAQILSFFIDVESQLWLCTNNGIIQHQNPINKINRARGLKVDYVTKVMLYDSGWLIATYGNGLRFYDKQSGISLPKVFESLKTTIVLDILKTDQEIWIATMNNGIYVFNRNTQTLNNLTVANGLSNNNVKHVQQDAWGNKWIGTSGGGVSVFNNSAFLEYNKSNGLNSNYIYAVLKDIDQNLWVATQGLGVIRISDSSTVLFDEEYGFESVKTKAVFQDSKQNIWFGTEGSGVGVIINSLNKDTVFQFSNTNGLHNNWVKSFSEDTRKNRVYLGTANGIYTAEIADDLNGVVNFKRLKSDELKGRFNDLKWNNKQRKLYFASEHGIGYLKNNELHYLESNTHFRNIVDFDSVLWCGSLERGVLKLKLTESGYEKTWYDQTKGLASPNIYQLTPDYPLLWIGTEKGLTKLNTKNEKVVHYGYEEGFEGVETNINASSRDNLGNLWFGTTDGLFLFNKGNTQDTLQNSPPYFFLEDVQIFYQSISETDYSQDFLKGNKIILPHSSNHIGFKIKALHFTYQNKIKFRWKLIGEDDIWGPPLDNNIATYSNLKPGEYTFLVKASIDDDWTATPVAFNFVIEAPYWDKTWFKAFYISIISLFFIIIVLLLIRRVRRKNKAIIDKIEIEKSILELEQKALRLQMNPHFIFNVLNSIHNLIILNDSGKARYALAKFSKLMRQVLENSREKLISIDDELETIQNYVQLEKLTTNTQFELIIEVDDSIDTNEPILPPLMIQPFIENAIIHGFKNISHDGIIKLTFSLKGEHILVCEIEDNGSGREYARSHTAQQENYHKSTALQVTQERLASLNSDNIDSGFDIVDLMDKDGQPMGTLIRIRIKI